MRFKYSWATAKFGLKVVLIKLSSHTSSSRVEFCKVRDLIIYIAKTWLSRMTILFWKIGRTPTGKSGNGSENGSEKWNLKIHLILFPLYVSISTSVSTVCLCVSTLCFHFYFHFLPVSTSISTSISTSFPFPLFACRCSSSLPLFYIKCSI